MMERSYEKSVFYNVATISTLGRYEAVIRLTKKTPNTLSMTGDQKTGCQKTYYRTVRTYLDAAGANVYVKQH